MSFGSRNHWPNPHRRNPTADDLPPWAPDGFPFEFVRFHAGFLDLHSLYAECPYMVALSPAQFREMLETLAQACQRRYPVVGLHPMRLLFNSNRNALTEAVFERDGQICRHCGTTDNLSIDHIYPVSLGGTNALDNLQVLCRSCNSRKGARV